MLLCTCILVHYDRIVIEKKKEKKKALNSTLTDLLGRALASPTSRALQDVRPSSWCLSDVRCSFSVWPYIQVENRNVALPAAPACMLDRGYHIRTWNCRPSMNDNCMATSQAPPPASLINCAAPAYDHSENDYWRAVRQFIRRAPQCPAFS